MAVTTDPLADNARLVTDASDGFLPAGTGAVARSIDSKLEDTLSVLDFGAVADNTGDNAAAFQAAHDAAFALGKVVRVPIGIYKFLSGINYKAPMFGERGSTSDYTAGELTSNLNFGTVSGWAITVDGNNKDQNPLYMRDLYFLGSTGAGHNGIRTINTSVNRYSLDGCVFRLFDIGADLDGWIGRILNCYFLACNSGLLLRNANGVLVSGGETQACENIGIHVISAKKVAFVGHTVENGTSAIGIKIAENVSAVSIDQSYFESNDVHIEVGVGGTGNSDDSVTATIITNNHFAFSQRRIVLDNVSGVFFRGNSIDDLSAVTMTAKARGVQFDFMEKPSNSDQGQTIPIFDTAINDDTSEADQIAENLHHNPYFVDGAGYAEIQDIALTSAFVSTNSKRGPSALELSYSGSGYPRCKLFMPDQAWWAANAPGKFLWTVIDFFEPSGVTYRAFSSFSYRNDGDEVQSYTGSTIDLTAGWKRRAGWYTVIDDGSTLTDFSFYLGHGSGADSAGQKVYFQRALVGFGRYGLTAAINGSYRQGERAGGFQFGRMIVPGTAAPADSSVAAAVGARVINTDPGTMDTTEGWICTVAGSPGTWVEMLVSV